MERRDAGEYEGRGKEVGIEYPEYPQYSPADVYLPDDKGDQSQRGTKGKHLLWRFGRIPGHHK